MTDRQSDRTMKEIISDAVERQLAQDPSEDMSLEDFAEMVQQAQTRQKRRRIKMLSVAAMFLLVIIGAAVALNTLTTDVGANKNEKEEIVTEDGVVIEDGGYGSSDGEDNVWSTVYWEEVETAKEHYENLLIPEYIPEGYEFQSLTVEEVQTDGITIEYVFYDEVNKAIEIEIFATEGTLMSMNVEGDCRILDSLYGNIYVQDIENKATIQLDGGDMISIWGELPDEEVIKIIDNLTN